MAIQSADTLFNFTTRFDYLVDIFHFGFRPRYYLELIPELNIFDYKGYEIIADLFNNDKSFKEKLLHEDPSFAEALIEYIEKEGAIPFEIGIPMTCFCDIPLSRVKDHMDLYGDYGIGMNKDWGKNKKVSPIIYVQDQSRTIQILEFALKWAKDATESPQNDATVASAYSNLYSIVSYIKPYEGKFFRNGKYTDKPIRFYDEREWRYVPVITHEDNKEGPQDDYSISLRSFLDKNEFNSSDSIKKERLKIRNQRLGEKHSLNFEWKDVKYIILPHKEDIPKFLRILEEKKSNDSKNFDEELQILTSKIITRKQIIDDF